LILGGGAVVRVLHAPALARLGWSRHVKVLEVSEKARESLRNECPDLVTEAGDFRDVLADPQVRDRFDGVVVALPNHLHEEAVKLALRAGLPVLCEKPLAATREAAMQLAALAAECRCPLSVAMVRRLVPWAGAVRSALRAGMIGTVQSIKIEHGREFHWPTDSAGYFSREHGGLLLNMGVHYLDLIEDWVGPLTPERYDDDCEGGVEANFRLELGATDGIKVELALSYTRKLADEVVISGTKGSIRASVDSFDECEWESKDAGVRWQLKPVSPYRSGEWPRDFVASFAEQFYEFALVIAGREQPRVSATASAATLGSIEWAYRNRGRILELPGPRNPQRVSMDPVPTVVTGGTGFVGGKLVERLTELGFNDVTVPIRFVGTSANVARFPVDRVQADLLNYESTRAALKNVKCVFHLAYGAGGIDAVQATVLGTRNVVEAAIANQAEVVVVVSTASVFGHPKTDRPIDESFSYRSALGEYGDSKTKAERYCLARAKTAGKTRIVVISPSAVYGPCGRLFTENPARWARSGSFCWIEDGRGKLNYVYVDNLVDALILAAQNPKAHGERFLINDGVTTFRKFLEPLLSGYAEGLPSFTRQQLVEREKPNRAGFRDVVRVLTGDEMMGVVNRLPVLAAPKKLIEKRLTPLYGKLQKKRTALRMEGHSTVPAPGNSGGEGPAAWLADIFGPIEIEYSSAKAREILGWQPRVTLEEGLEASIAWLKYLGLYREPSLTSRNTGTSANSGSQPIACEVT
jgi:nucleoside-diphosphate-sugar epimerase/predicted dehydrogenase